MAEPINTMLDMVNWRNLPERDSPVESPLPYATHAGELMIGDFTFRVFQLSDGQRVFDADDVEKFFRFVGE
jgi:hypothetical protein